MRWAALGGLLLSLAGCLDFDGTYERVVRNLDAGSGDGGAPPTDAGATDAGATDAGATDAGATDAGATDAGATDAGATDAGTTDAGPTDAGTPDAGTPDAGPTDAGGMDAGCGPMRLRVLEVFIDDGGIPGSVGLSIGSSQWMTVGNDAQDRTVFTVRPGGARGTAIDTLTFSAWGVTGDEYFSADFYGGGYFRLDAGYSSALTGACSGMWAEGVYSEEPRVGLFCTDDHFTVCEWRDGGVRKLPLGPGPAAGATPCNGLSRLLDGTLVRYGNYQPDGGALSAVGVALWPDGGLIPLPTPTTSNVSHLTGVSPAELLMLDTVGTLWTWAGGQWRRAALDGGILRDAHVAAPDETYAVGVATHVYVIDGHRVCPAEFEAPFQLPAAATLYTVRGGPPSSNTLFASGFLVHDADAGTSSAYVLRMLRVPR